MKLMCGRATAGFRAYMRCRWSTTANRSVKTPTVSDGPSKRKPFSFNA